MAYPTESSRIGSPHHATSQLDNRTPEGLSAEELDGENRNLGLYWPKRQHLELCVRKWYDASVLHPLRMIVDTMLRELSYLKVRSHDSKFHLHEKFNQLNSYRFFTSPKLAFRYSDVVHDAWEDPLFDLEKSRSTLGGRLSAEVKYF